LGLFIWSKRRQNCLSNVPQVFLGYLTYDMTFFLPLKFFNIDGPKTFLGVITLLIIVLNRFYATNMYTTLKTTIYLQSNLRNSGLLLLLFEFHDFSFLIDIIDNIIYTSGSWDQNSNDSAVLLSRVSVCITWPVYCIAIGGSSGHLIRTYIFYICVLV